MSHMSYLQVIHVYEALQLHGFLLASINKPFSDNCVVGDSAFIVHSNC